MSDPARVVVLAPNWLGDVVMALPAIAALRAWHPSAHLAVAARGSVAPLLALVPGIDAVVRLEGRGGWRDLFAARADAQQLAAGRFDVAVLLPNSMHAALLAARAGIAQRWGYRADLRGRLLTRAVAKPRIRLHQAEYYRALTTALGAPETPLVAALRIDAALRDRARTLLTEHGWRGGPLVGFAPGAAFGLAKRWPPDRVAHVAATLARDHNTTPVVAGARGDIDSARQVAAAYHAKVGQSTGPALVNLAGRTDLLTLVGVLASCTAVVSNDSGAMHVAAAAGVPVVGLYGPTDERATSPLPHPAARSSVVVTGVAWCRPCHLRSCPLDHRCMVSIDPGRVIDSITRLLTHARVPGARA